MPKPSAHPGKGTPGKVNDIIVADSDGSANALPGDDTVFHIVGSAVTPASYKGSAGVDTLELQLTTEEWLTLAPTLQQELDDYLVFLVANTNPSGQANGKSFTFDSLGLQVKQFEAVRIVVDGQELTPGDDPVDAVDDSFATLNTGIISGSVLTNDSVPDLVADVTLVSGPSMGALTFYDDGTFDFDPEDDFDDLGAGEFRDVAFSYEVTDSNGDSDIAVVAITVEGTNVPPVANDDSAITDEDTAVIISVLENDTDANDDALSISAKTDATNGSVAINGDGTVTYTPDADFNGVDSFTYTVSDGNGGFDTATVDVVINPVNDAPTAGDTTVLLESGDSVEIDLAALGADVDGTVDPSSVAVDDTGTLGAVSAASGGVVTYTAPDSGTGALTDTFEFRLDDNEGATSNAGTVSVNVFDTGTATGSDSAVLDNGQTVSLDISTDTSTIDDESPLSIDISRSDLDEQVINVSLVIDASGSVGRENYREQLIALQTTAAELADNFGGTGIEVNLQVVRFSTFSEERTYSLVTDDISGESFFLRESASALRRIEDFSTPDPDDSTFTSESVNLNESARLDTALSAAFASPDNASVFPGWIRGWTDYTAALKQTEEFFAGTAGEENFMMFISDGRPQVSGRLVPGGALDPNEWQPIVTGLKTGPEAVQMDAIGFGGVVSNPVGQVALNFIDDDATAEFLTDASQLTSAISASPLFSAEVVDFDVFLSINGGGQTVVAGDGLDDVLLFDDSILTSNGANFEYDLASLTGLSTTPGDTNDVTVRVRFDEDGDLSTTGDQRVLEASTTILAEDTSGLFV
ncbi:cadherin-like domain-containing protein [Falsiruegeria litorea]|uniref:cadherin-like domain-containing protein n=1 Tax=Falsiruegeria litorea TaxID=1280831 RepID=UPI001BFE48AE|nr:cadherin-like domain-containing protein [Falsiruegeria litorea]MBT8169830.1 tandem-95 repeat protein [Falsiruegeria litorea]